MRHGLGRVPHNARGCVRDGGAVLLFLGYSCFAQTHRGRAAASPTLCVPHTRTSVHTAPQTDVPSPARARFPYSTESRPPTPPPPPSTPLSTPTPLAPPSHKASTLPALGKPQHHHKHPLWPSRPSSDVTSAESLTRPPRPRALTLCAHSPDARWPAEGCGHVAPRPGEDSNVCEESMKGHVDCP